MFAKNRVLMPRLTGGQAVVEQLGREGVDIVFGMAGVHTLEIYDAIGDSDIDQITTRHEQGAGFMADGYARTTGRVGVVLVITGPGLTNATTPIGQAYSDSSPMLVISSQNETNEADQGKGYLHELKDQQGAMESIAAYSEQIDRVIDIPDAIAEAFDYLENHRPRPIHLQIPTDVLAREDRIDLEQRDSKSASQLLDKERIDAAVDYLATAEQPLLLVGGGASGAAEQARRFVESTGITTISTVAGKGVIPEDHALSLGATMGREAVSKYINSRDLLLAVGTELSPREIRSIDLPTNLIQIDLDYQNFGKIHPTELGIVADAGEAFRALTSSVEERSVRFNDEREAVAELRTELAEDESERDDRHRILATLREAIDSDCVIVNDMTKLCYEATEALPVYEPDTFLFPRGYGTLGFSPPVAYGAAIGLPNQQVVSLVGDGGFLFTVQDLATAIKYNLGVPIVVLNDDCYGVIHDTQVRDYDGRTIGTDIDNPDFVALARAFGAAAERIDIDEVENALPIALDKAFARDRPTVIEIPIDF